MVHQAVNPKHAILVRCLPIRCLFASAVEDSSNEALLLLGEVVPLRATDALVERVVNGIQNVAHGDDVRTRLADFDGPVLDKNVASNVEDPCRGCRRRLA